MRLWMTGLLGPVLLCACTSLPTAEKPVAWDPAVVQGTLANGLQYRLVRATDDPGRLDLRLTVKAGSVDESEQQIGVAHLVEHLVFYSHGQQPGTVRERMQALGWEQGKHFNAQTNYDRTQYLLSPSRGVAQLDQGLQALRDLVFAADYSAADLDHERAIVVEEWRGGLGVAQRMNQQRTASQRVGSRYPAHRTIGNEAAIQQAPLAQLQAFQQRWYQPQNMVVNVVGDIDPPTVLAQLQRSLGAPAGTALPARDNRDLPLDNHLKIFQLQDSQSGSSQVALLFRLHETASRQPGSEGLRQRLIDRLTLAALVAQLQRQPKAEGVRSLTAQKTMIGDYSTVLGIAAGAEPGQHRQAWTQLLEEIERARRHGLQRADINAEREQVRGIAQRMLQAPDRRSFQQWVNDLNDVAATDKHVQSKHAIARAYLHVLDSITLEDVNQRLRLWTDTPDQVMQLSARGLTAVEMPTVSQIEQQRAQLRQQPITLAQPQASAPVVAPLPALPAPAAAGHITLRQSFPKERVEHWDLSNGDRLVWLRRKGADGQFQLKAQSSAGYGLKDIAPWRAQMALQLAQQSGPEGWDASMLKRWRQTQGAPLSTEQLPQRLTISLNAKPDALPQLLQSYRLSQSVSGIDPQVFDAAKTDLAERLPEQPNDAAAARLSELRHGSQPTVTPQALDALQVDDLNGDWHQLSQAPVTYYLMADVEPAVLEPLVNRELASIPRGTPLPSQPELQRPGQRQATLDIALEPRARVTAERYSALPWTPADAVGIALLRDLANQQLKAALRTRAAGIYRLDFKADLNPDTQRIESRLSFTCDPARVDELWQLATQTLAQLPRNLDVAQLQRLRQQLLLKERLRRDDPDTQLRRLMLSEQRWGDPRYLGQQSDLTAPLDIKRLQQLAQRLAADDNSVRLQVLPAPQTAVQP
ncbi:insulinase family protein [Pseudomonas sp. TE3610]